MVFTLIILGVVRSTLLEPEPTWVQWGSRQAMITRFSTEEDGAYVIAEVHTLIRVDAFTPVGTLINVAQYLLRLFAVLIETALSVLFTKLLMPVLHVLHLEI